MRWDREGIDLTTPREQRITHAYAASLSNYEAHQLGLPRTIEATLLVSVEGRILNAVAELGFIDKGQAVIVTSVDGLRVVVRPADETRQQNA